MKTPPRKWQTIRTTNKNSKKDREYMDESNLDTTITEPAKRCYNAKGARIDNTTRWQTIRPTDQGGKASTRSDHQNDDDGKPSASEGGKASARR